MAVAIQRTGYDFSLKLPLALPVLRCVGAGTGSSMQHGGERG
jgi:hypothetical protein